MLLRAVFVAVIAGVGGASVCDGRDALNTPPGDVLRGAHLRVLELQWAPYAIKDPISGNWSGFDVDLFNAVADILGFTFEIGEVPMLPDETYTELLLRTVTETDMWLSWWMRTDERMQGSSMLLGHVDSSPVLIAPPPSKDRVPFDTFFRPFSYPLWGCLCLMILLSGLVDYYLERGYGGTLSSSIYEYFGGVLWGGFQDPHTKLSAVFQVCNSLLVMVVVAAYTANLAAFMLAFNNPNVKFGSVLDLM